MKCTHCNTERAAKGDRLPPRWKRLPGPAGAPCCPRCWQARYILRAVTVPIAGPADAGNATEAAVAWEELRRRLRLAWGASTRLANWAVQQLQQRDVVRTADMAKLPNVPEGVYLYGLFGAYVDRGLWDGAAASAQSLLRSVEACWRESRWDVIWHYAASARTYRWPTPFPVHNACWELAHSADGVWSCSLTLPGGRLVLRIRNDRRWHRQFARLRQLLSGEAVPGDAAIYAHVVQGADRNNGMMLRGPGGRQDYRVMLKLVGWFPRPDRSGGDGTLTVRTGATCLLMATQADREPWIYHGDELRTRVIGHLAMLQRWSDDTKHERRFPRAVRRHHAEAMQRRVTKHRDYMRTALHTLAKMVVEFAARSRCGVIDYDDSERAYLPKFPYHELRQLIEVKADERGIRMAASAPVMEPASAADAAPSDAPTTG